MVRNQRGIVPPFSIPRRLFLLLWLFLPTQLGKHFWPAFSLVNGIRADYLAPTIYGTDLLAVCLIGAVFVTRGLPPKRKLIQGGLLALLLFLPVVWVQEPGPHVYGWVKLVEYLGLFWAATQVQVPVKKKLIIFLAILSGLSVLTIFQAKLQGSVGGMTYWLGERSFTTSTPGVAQAEIGGRLHIRPYGTFSHPNSLAGFFLVLWWFTIDQFTRLKAKEKQIFKFGLLGAGVLSFVSFLLLWSRTAWVVGIGSLVLLIGGWYRKPQRWFKIMIGGVSLGLMFPVLTKVWLLFFPSTSESFLLRDQLYAVGASLFAMHPIFGVGLKGFIPQLARWQLALNRTFLQPIHNGFWLILVETGLVGFVGLLWVIINTTYQVVSQRRWGLWLALLAVVLLAANDHYWVTLQQNQLLIVLLLAEIWQKRISNKS